MDFNAILQMSGIAPETCAVMLHAPVETAEKRALSAPVEDDPELFRCYQDNHPRNAEATLMRRPVAASFVVEAGDDARFAGLFRVAGYQFVSAPMLDADPTRKALQQRFRGADYVTLHGREGGRRIFDLVPDDRLSALRGRLVVRRTPGRAYMRLAENNCLEVVEIARQARFAPPAPDWTGFILTAEEVRTLPRSWVARLQEWRGIYLIMDIQDNARYVGAAYGADNLAGRWRQHVAGDAGITAELADRNPATFRFSILELMAPTAPADTVIGAENRWKELLGTRYPGGLNRN
jgi:hypothetical protein